MSSEINSSFIKTSTNKEEIYKIILSHNTNKSSGPSRIPTKVLHLLQDEISNHLATICNLSFSTGIFPAILRTAKVIPIHKKNSKLEEPNYRHIFFLSSIENIFETDLLNFLMNNKFSVTGSWGSEIISRQTEPF